MLSFRHVYIFTYNLFQFCGHTWILANTIARFLKFGQDALADTFYSVGFVMSLCQLLSILELFHIADGIEKARLLPRFIQVMEKNLLLILVIVLEEMQSKPVVCVQFMMWNILDLLRYPHELLQVMDTPSVAMLWTRYTLWIPLYILSVATEGVIIYQALPYIEPTAETRRTFTSPSTCWSPCLFSLLVRGVGQCSDYTASETHMDCSGGVHYEQQIQTFKGISWHITEDFN
uniref:Very-long-chain (3R)-3-hydroxyacyl-CoA dehydratase n=1 Tax=Scophthalmus maximus TaxID=52904 RepID=A0A8D2ZSJ2_SCOMX